MSRPKITKRRVLGPYQNGNEWRIVVVDGGRSDLTYPSESAARSAKKKIEANWHRLDEITVDDALTKYRAHLERKGTKPISFNETLRRLRLFFPDHAYTLVSLTKQSCAAYYDAFTEGRSVDYHRNTLAEARSFLRWCVEQEWLATNPLDGVKGVGRRSKGKAQLTADEAFRFVFAALWMTNAGDDGALGAAMLLLMGLRQSEVWKRRVRDVDRNGTVLVVEDAKTKAGERAVKIPGVLQPYLAELARGRLPMSPLFSIVDEDGEHAHTKAWLRFAVDRVCAAAQVPRVTPHGLRGTHATLGEREHVVSDTVAAAIGHAGMSAYGSYAQPAAVREAAQERALKVISGGKR